ncbi:phosphatase PAP2 family protein [Devosia psychrophila]|uniref:PAP2 superfamily protein n=1 Tax=Devosia psychrophila TaxID=728005 RepID=A0A1I1NWN0_9HYPH|nr:phosphatase PAP2 family protein [Devosia psychrophila]SFD01865.1 PAP2 superfamily protein [Devosia psychrophila]
MFKISVSAATLVFLVFAYCCVAAAAEPVVYLVMLGHYAWQLIAIPAVIVIGLPIAALCMRPKAPASFISDVMRHSGVRVAFIAGIFCAGLAAFTTLKIHIPKIMPFWADPVLADIDRWIHRGKPGLALYSFLPSYAEYPIAWLYGPGWFILWFGIVAAMALHSDRQRRLRYFWAMALSILLLGTVTATAMASVGPIFYASFVEPTRFAELIRKIDASAFGDYMKLSSQYLLSSYQFNAPSMGTGISAMPSMHLAIATLNACMLFNLSRALGWLAWAYVVIIQVGSVYLGWHYAIDGYVSIAGLSLIWFVTGLPVWKTLFHRIARRARPLRLKPLSI